jgi:hypothetical protein
MPTVWSRSLRPQSSCRCISCTNSVPSILSRRTTTGIARKRLNAGDAFTLLLGPLLGGALIADTQAKNERRKAWDEKIAAVQAEVEQIRRSGVGTYNIRSRTLRRLPALNRHYSSAVAARPAVVDEDGEDPIEAVEWPSTHVGSPLEGSPSTSIAHIHDSGPNQKSTEPHAKAKLSQTTIETCKRVQRLVAIKLAIRMILHVHMGKSPRYINTSSDYVYEHDQGRLPHNANELIRHLKQVSNTLRSLTSEELRLSWAAYQNLTRGQMSSLDKDMCNLARQFRHGEMNVTQLIENFAERLLSSSESPTVYGYIPFLKVLSRARFDELGSMVDGTMIEARLPYDRHSIFTLLWQYGKNKEARCFERLIKKLTTDGANARFGEQWLWRNIDGTLVPIPPSQDPQILQILIYAALKCNQPHRAEAWSRLLSWTRNGHMWLSHVMRNFLRYYSAHRNWHKGNLWLRTALDQAEILAGQGIRHVQRVAFAMLDFCVAYGERSLYRDIMKAAGECRLGVYSADPDLTLTRRATDILRDWELYHGSINNGDIDALPAVERARMFSRKLQHIHGYERNDKATNHHPRSLVDSNEQFPARSNHSDNDGGLQDLRGNGHVGLLKPSHVFAISDQNAETVKWRDLCGQQQAQLDSLKRQLDQMRSFQEQEFGSGIGAADRGRTDVVGTIDERHNDSSAIAVALTFKVEQVKESGRMASIEQATVRWRSMHTTSDSRIISHQPSSRPSPGRVLHMTAPTSPIEQLSGPQASSSMEDSTTLFRRVDSERRSIRFPNQAFVRPSLDPSPENRDKSQLPLGRSLPQRGSSHQLASDANIPGNSDTSTIEEDFRRAPPASLHPTHLLRHPPSLSELDRALTFCAHIIHNLTDHVKTSQSIRPLYMLVSTLPRDLVARMTIEGTFAHFVRQMLTRWEQDVFLEKLTADMREGHGGGALPAARAEAEAEAESRVESKVETKAQAEPEIAEEDDEEKHKATPPLPITHEIQLPKQVIRPIESGSTGLPMSRTPYRSLRLQLGVEYGGPAAW